MRRLFWMLVGAGLTMYVVIRGRELTARPAAAGRGPEGRALFDASYRSVSVSLNDGKGKHCAGTLPRVRKGPRK